MAAFELFPLFFLGGQQHQHQVGADAEVFALVGDDHGVEVFGGLVDAGADHGDLVVAERVHFAVELDAKDAVADVDQRCAAVLLHHPAGALHILEHGDAGAVFEGLIGIGEQIEVLGVRLAVAIGGLVEGLGASAEHLLDVFGNLALFAAHARDGVFDAQGVPELERAKRIGVAPAHGAIDFDHAIGNLGHHGRPSKAPGR